MRLLALLAAWVASGAFKRAPKPTVILGTSIPRVVAIAG